MMKLQRAVLLALATHLAAIGATGCKRSTDTTDEDSSDPAASEADPASVTDVGPTTATDPLPEPPAAKVEEPGPAPSANDVWMGGYWWWDRPHSEYAWSPGYWQDRTVEA